MYLLDKKIYLKNLKNEKIISAPIEGSQILEFGKIGSVLTEILHARITQHFLGGSPFHEPNPITQRQIPWVEPGLTPLACSPKNQV